MNLLWIPWHKVVSLRQDLRSGELSLASFAADLYDVALRRGKQPSYEDPAQFFCAHLWRWQDAHADHSLPPRQ